MYLYLVYRISTYILPYLGLVYTNIPDRVPSFSMLQCKHNTVVLSGYLLYAILLYIYIYIFFLLFAGLKCNVVILNTRYVGYNELCVILFPCVR